MGICIPELLSYRKPKHVVQNKKNGDKNPNNSHSYHDEIKFYQGIGKKEHMMTLNTRTMHTPKNSPIDCDGVVQLANAQYHIVPLSILWYRES